MALWNWLSSCLWNTTGQDVESLPDLSQPQSKQTCRCFIMLQTALYLLLVYISKLWVLLYIPHSCFQILKTWHLVCVVCAVTGVGILLILARTVAQALTDPTLVTNRENPEGATVSDTLDGTSEISRDQRQLGLENAQQQLLDSSLAVHKPSSFRPASSLVRENPPTRDITIYN